MARSLGMTPPLILVTETEAAQQQAVRTHLEETGFSPPYSPKVS